MKNLENIDKFQYSLISYEILKEFSLEKKEFEYKNNKNEEKIRLLIAENFNLEQKLLIYVNKGFLEKKDEEIKKIIIDLEKDIKISKLTVK